jgi:Domain of unknown function (DUF4417)
VSRPPLRLEYRLASELSPNPGNPKFHPPEQVGAIDGLLSRVGWAGALLLNERTGMLLDGHARRDIALAKGGPVPVLIGSWSEEEERAILGYLDPTGWTSVVDRAKLEALLKLPMPRMESAECDRLMDAVKASAKLLEDAPDAGQLAEAKQAEQLDISVALDSLWPSADAWDTPALLAEMQADQIPAPVMTWGIQAAGRRMAGTWHCYTHDKKFEPLWRKPHRVLLSRPSAIVEPNFSTTDQTPFALALWNTYRKRWIGRYWQACGLKLFVDLNVDAALNAPSEALGGRRMNLLGVPAGWKAYATRAHANRPENLLVEWEVAKSHAGVEGVLFLVIGGGQAVQQMAREKGWAWFAEQQQKAHGKGDDGPEASD